MYKHTMLNLWNSSNIFSWIILFLLQTPKGNFCYSYLPQSINIVKSCLAPGNNSMWYYPKFKSRDDAYVNPYRFSSISCILGIRNDFLRIIWFSFLKPDKNINVPFLFGWIKVGDTHSYGFTFLSNPIWHNRSTSLRKMDLCARCTGYVFGW